MIEQIVSYIGNIKFKERHIGIDDGRIFKSGFRCLSM